MNTMAFILLLATIPDSVIYPVAALPLVLVVITWVLIIARRKADNVAGVIFDGKKWVKWLLFAYVAIILLNILGTYIPGHWIPTLYDKKGGNEGFFLVMYFTAYTFVCYFLVSFRLANEEELKEAKGAKKLAVSFVKDAATAATGAAGVTASAFGLFLAMLSSLLYPVVTVAGQSFIYLGVGAAGFFAGVALFLPIVYLIAVVGSFLILVIVFLTCLIVLLATVFKFLSNIRYFISVKRR